jgi:hypothetical protein
LAKGNNKLTEDFDGARIIRDLNDMKVLFNYYKERHCNVMIEVNKQTSNVLNIEDDGWDDKANNK